MKENKNNKSLEKLNYVSSILEKIHYICAIPIVIMLITLIISALISIFRINSPLNIFLFMNFISDKNWIISSITIIVMINNILRIILMVKKNELYIEDNITDNDLT